MISLKMNNYFNKIYRNKFRLLLLSATGFALYFSVRSWNHNENDESSCPDPSASPPTRIVSTSLASDELLVRILKKAGALDRLVAVSRFAENPTYSHISTEVVNIKARVGDNLEALASLRPDLVVFASFNRPAVTSTLKGIAAQTCWLDAFESLHDIRSNILKLGAAAGLSNAATQIAHQFESDIQTEVRATTALTDATNPHSKPRVLSFDGSGTVMAGKTTFDDLVRLAGGINAASAASLAGWPRINDEALAAMAPEIIVLLTDTRSAEDLIAQLQNTPGWRETPAVINNRFVTPSSADLLALSPDVLRVVPALRAKFYGPSNQELLP